MSSLHVKGEKVSRKGLGAAGVAGPGGCCRPGKAQTAKNPVPSGTGFL